MTVEKVCAWVESLVQQAGNLGLIAAEDAVYSRNQLLLQLGIDDFYPDVSEQLDESVPDLLEKISDAAEKLGVTGSMTEEKEQLQASLMNVFIPLPSVVNERFYAKYEKDPKEATDYFYHLSRSSNYIQTKRIAKNIHYKAESEYGTLDITINLSKPEKDPKEIEKERELKKEASYPLCVLCMENEGYGGRIGHPARSNHRLIRVPLEGERWYLQYSPYVYYPEHCILLAEKHRDMAIGPETFQRLLSFVGRFPHYFMGSNADIPIVGGSILSHDHYQGGRYEFALAGAPDDESFVLDGYPDIAASVVRWPMTVLRLRADDPASLVSASSRILKVWKSYNDPGRHILSHTGSTPHNTITPIARRKGSAYEMDLVLRNNRTDEEHPAGIFHPHEDVHHIKKENIGLIEVMGLAVLPKRLAHDLKDVEQYLLGRKEAVAKEHQAWAEQLKALRGPVKDEAEAADIVQKETGKKFLRVLEDAGVFKRTEDGKQGLRALLGTINDTK
ncbi:UDP-glucose--hexose-1-phosphate uridylyltransferase [Salibacterium halotolerans]|uniref:Galactose-1-phosphate uridylyltransferase n=1 Tax=Salibacterium halotolerans TaxID=1884432 RepID=A0A1I5LIJ7_9BACI|nr:UDP-glucose--hexose-1-phosphate uridylyltransferase [Salibacterium halotolerans]SFO97002.1 UDPglucose--hexose-1-phosphate uridylyltransferase [Salibacterium halotolerans]